MSVAEFGMLLRDSEYKENLTYEDVLKLAENNKGNDKYEYKAEFIQMVEKASEIEKEIKKAEK